MDVASYDEEGARALDAAVEAARALPSDGWLQRLVEGAPFGPVEALLAEVRGTVYARAKAQEAGYGLETELAEPDGALVSSRGRGGRGCSRALHKPLAALGAAARGGARGRARLARRAGARAGRRRDPRARRGGARRSPRGSRCSRGSAARPTPSSSTGSRSSGSTGANMTSRIHRRWLDPTKPLARGGARAGRRRAGHLGDACAAARTGPRPKRAPAPLHLPSAAGHFEAESPFDYAGCSEVLIVTDVKQGDIAALAGAYARLIEAARGGTLGLFTAIQRLKAVHARIADRLARAGLPLLAQHVDPIDAGTLVDIFRDDPRASLLGTDALRDGVDVPGESLRLVVMERVPWPRPTVLHAARRMAGGGSAYDDRVVRARLAQAFGRLIRRQGDCGRVRDPVGGDAVAAAHGVPAGRADPPRAARRGDRAGRAAAARASASASANSR